MFPETIETDRLRLERLSRETVDPLTLYEYASEDAPHVEETTRYVTWEPHETPKETAEFIDRMEQAWEDDEAATYAVRPREGEDGAGEFAGTAGLGVDWDRRVAEPGVWLRKKFWGRGYSGERARALMEVAFERLDLDALVVGVHVDNEKSLSAVSEYVEAAGGRREGVVRRAESFAGEPGAVDLVRFSVLQSEYRAATGE